MLYPQYIKYTVCLNPTGKIPLSHDIPLYHHYIYISPLECFCRTNVSGIETCDGRSGSRFFVPLPKNISPLLLDTHIYIYIYTLCIYIYISFGSGFDPQPLLVDLRPGSPRTRRRRILPMLLRTLEKATWEMRRLATREFKMENWDNLGII